MATKPPKVIGVIQEQDGNRVTEWHANGALASADYSTICGLDGNDAAYAGTLGTVAAPRGQKITCPHCLSAWESWRQFKRADFAPPPSAPPPH